MKSSTTQIVLAEFVLSQPSSRSTKQPAWQTSIDWWFMGHQPYSHGWSTFRRSDYCRFTDTHSQQISFDEIDTSVTVEREKARWVEDFLFDTEHSSLQLYRTVCKADYSDYQYSDYLSIVSCYPYRRLISRFRCGCRGLHIATGRFGKDSEHRSREDRVCLVCMLGSVEDERFSLWLPRIQSHTSAYVTYVSPVTSKENHIRQQYSHLFHSASPSVAAFLNTDQPNVVGSYLKTCVAQKQSILASPLSAWLLNFVEVKSVWRCGTSALLHCSITPAFSLVLYCRTPWTLWC